MDINPNLDGELYKIQFRITNKDYPNSPKAIMIANDRSDLLLNGEPTFDPIEKIFSIGTANANPYAVMSGNFDGNLVASKTPLTQLNTRIDHKSIKYGDVELLSVDYNKVSVQSIMMRDSAGADKVLVGSGYMLAAVNTMANIQRILTEILNIQAELALSHSVTTLRAAANADIDKLFMTLNGKDVINAEHNYSEVLGTYDNLLIFAEDYSDASWVKTNVTPTLDNTIVSPVGVKSGVYKLDDTSAVSDATVVQSIIIPSGDTKQRCFSTFLKKGTSPYTELTLSYDTGGTVVTQSAVINWSDLSVTGGAVIPANDGWYRLYIRALNNGTANTRCKATIRPAGRVSGNTDVGYVYAWGSMVNVGAVPDIYIP